MGQFRFVPPREVHAGRIVCRRWQEDDLEAMLESVSHSAEHLIPWMPWAKDYDLESAREFLWRHAPRPTPHAADSAAALSDEPVAEAVYAICDPAGAILGSCGLHGRLGIGGLEIGYWVDVRHTRQGIATLAAALLTETAFAVPGIELTEIHHDRANHASGAIPPALGYRHVATMRRDPLAPAETGLELQWRMERSAFAESPAARLLEAARR